jgi:hypothetical protein
MNFINHILSSEDEEVVGEEPGTGEDSAEDRKEKRRKRKDREEGGDGCRGVILLGERRFLQ